MRASPWPPGPSCWSPRWTVHWPGSPRACTGTARSAEGRSPIGASELCRPPRCVSTVGTGLPAQHAGRVREGGSLSVTSNPTQLQPDAPETKLFSIATERFCRENLLTQRGQLLRLRSDLQALAEDGSVRPDAAKLPHLEASALLEAIEARLASVDSALARLRSGQFGLCGECGDPIPEERLRARPDAEFCVPCCQRQRRSA